MLSLYKLEIFNAVADAGSFSAAADHLLLTQPAISQHIQDLEAATGTQLFKRGRRGVQLTPAGELLLDYTRRILQLVSEAENAVTDIEHLAGGQIRIGATPGVGGYVLPGWVQSFQQRYPQVLTSLRTDTTPQITEHLLNHTLDIGVVEGEWVENWQIEKVVLQQIDHFVIVQAEHPWVAKQVIPMQALQKQPFITRSPGSQTRAWLDSIMALHGITLNIVAEFDNPEAIKQAVNAGMGITILPDYTVRHEQQLGMLCALPVQDADLQRTMKLIWERHTPFKPVMRAFVTHLAIRFPQLLHAVQAKIGAT
jgi:DNA-binding transcriptional LysR family regulator